MATVTGLTAARMAEMEAATIVDGEIVVNDLILIKHDASTINAGNVRGPAGPPGADGTDGVDGIDGAPGADGDSRLVIAALSADVGPITAQTVLQNITGLNFAIGTSPTEIWKVAYSILFRGANITMDIKFGFTVPAGCTMKWGLLGGGVGTPWVPTNPAQTPGLMLAQNSGVSTGTGTDVSCGVILNALVFGGGTAGNVQVQYAQNTSDAGNLRIEKGSVLEAIKIVE